jgi:hypothetical protein
MDCSTSEVWRPALTSEVWLAVFTGLLALLTWRNIVHLRRTERAYVSGGGFFPDITETTKGEEFSLRINNYGKTPAYVKHVVIGYWDLKKDGPLPKDFPGGRLYYLYYTLPPGVSSLQTDVKIPKSEITGDIIFGRFYYEDIFSRRWWWPFTRKVRWAGFVLRIDEKRYVWPHAAPRVYTAWT